MMINDVFKNFLGIQRKLVKTAIACTSFMDCEEFVVMPAVSRLTVHVH